MEWAGRRRKDFTIPQRTRNIALIVIGYGAAMCIVR